MLLGGSRMVEPGGMRTLHRQAAEILVPDWRERWRAPHGDGVASTPPSGSWTDPFLQVRQLVFLARAEYTRL